MCILKLWVVNNPQAYIIQEKNIRFHSYWIFYILKICIKWNLVAYCRMNLLYLTLQGKMHFFQESGFKISSLHFRQLYDRQLLFTWIIMENQPFLTNIVNANVSNKWGMEMLMELTMSATLMKNEIIGEGLMFTLYASI